MTTVTDKVLHVGIDVDDTSFHGAGFCNDTGEVFEFKCKPTKGALLVSTHLNSVRFRDFCALPSKSKQFFSLSLS